MRMHWKILATFLALVASAAPVPAAEAPPAHPDAPAAIAAPAGSELMFKLNAAGVQMYRAVQGKAGPQWKFVAPLANLSDDSGAIVAWHYAGPTWEGTDGSKAVKDPAAKMASAPAPHPAADIPWLLIALHADGSTAGRFTPATYVQRRDTRGGNPPPKPPVQAGATIGVPYTAVYWFYKKSR